jgi:hypothetical protein
LRFGWSCGQPPNLCGTPLVAQNLSAFQALGSANYYSKVFDICGDPFLRRPTTAMKARAMGTSARQSGKSFGISVPFPAALRLNLISLPVTVTIIVFDPRRQD